MDFMTLLRSAEQLLYEVVSWLVFFPLTLWRCLMRPIAMIAYAEKELTKPSEDQFLDALSPPIFLFITLMAAQVAQTSLPSSGAEFQGLLADQRNLLIFRAVTFSLFPLLLGLQHVKLNGQPLSRKSLRPMFYAQCYVTVPFVLVADIALMITSLSAPHAVEWGAAIFLAGFVWYVLALVRGFMIHRKASFGRSIVQTVIAVLLGTMGLYIAILLAFLTGSASLIT